MEPMTLDQYQLIVNRMMAEEYVHELQLEHSQEKGQRVTIVNSKLAPHESVSEIFIGKLPSDAYENEIIPMFALAGLIHKVRIPVHFSGATRGYAYVQYYDRESRDRALTMFNNRCLLSRPSNGKTLAVVKSTCNRRLYVHNLPGHLTPKHLAAELQNHLLDTSKIKIAMPRPAHFDVNNNTDSSIKTHSTYAFLEFSTHYDAAQARRILVPIKSMFGRRISFDWAKLKNDNIEKR